MPTTRPRHTLTEDDALGVALEDAGRRWPDEEAALSRLALRLLEEGGTTVEGDEQARIEERRRAVADTAGMFTGLYPPGYLEELRKDWPE